ncbi:hypothetical protein, partial [Gemmobacter denitrificans]
ICRMGSINSSLDASWRSWGRAGVFTRTPFSFLQRIGEISFNAHRLGASHIDRCEMVANRE